MRRKIRAANSYSISSFRLHPFLNHAAASDLDGKPETLAERRWLTMRNGLISCVVRSLRREGSGSEKSGHRQSSAHLRRLREALLTCCLIPRT
jgi:hypothetical protein